MSHNFLSPFKSPNPVLKTIDDYLPSLPEDGPGISELDGKLGNKISLEHHRLLIRMGKGLKSATIESKGLRVRSDWSWFTERMCLTDANFWRILSMLMLSLTYDFFIKVTFKIFGSQYIHDDMFLTQIGMTGFVAAGCSRMISPIIMQKIGFFKTYSGVLTIQAFLAFTICFVV